MKNGGGKRRAVWSTGSSVRRPRFAPPASGFSGPDCRSPSSARCLRSEPVSGIVGLTPLKTLLAPQEGDTFRPHVS
jgi:hypothetical protein